MHAGILNQEDLASLRTQAQLAGGPVMDLVRIDDRYQPVVAMFEYVMPLECFVVICFWMLSGANLYQKNLNNPVMDDVLTCMNGKTVFLRKADHFSCMVYMANRIRGLMNMANVITSENLYTHMENILLEAERLGHTPVLD